MLQIPPHPKVLDITSAIPWPFARQTKEQSMRHLVGKRVSPLNEEEL